ncbi:DUF3833 family protein [Sphingomicrobium sp. XHP0235]|uniref:DUF3833 family protein n=1 Tax=Sphingomicrobium aquimarinum TaxID=3133971 RepID=UPI0031FE9B96
MRAFTAAALALALCGCLNAVDLPDHSATPVLDPIQFFEGETSGRGTLSVITGERRDIAVSSTGTVLEDGSIRLVQRIDDGDGSPATRVVTMRALGDGRYEGTVTDAVEPLTAQVEGNRMTLRYRTPDERVRQILVLEDDRTLRNRLDAYRWGLNVARLDETIVKD